MPLGNPKQTKASSGSYKQIHVSLDQSLWIPVGEVTSLSFGASSSDIAADSNLDPEYSQTIPGRQAPIQMQFSYNLVDADEGQATLRARRSDRVKFFVRACPYWAVGASKHQGLCYVSSISVSAPDNGVNTQDCTLTIIGELVESPLLGSDVN